MTNAKTRICVHHDELDWAGYVGVTTDLKGRVYQHRTKQIEGFTKKYCLEKLVYSEAAAEISSAIAREKQLKAGARRKKIQLIEGLNPSWLDLYDQI